MIFSSIRLGAFRHRVAAGSERTPLLPRRRRFL